MRKIFTLAVATFFASAAFANYDLTTKAQKADSLAIELNYIYEDYGVDGVDAFHKAGLNFRYGLMDGLELNLRMPTYTKDAEDEFIPANPWLGLVYDINEMFAVKLAGELAFIRDPKDLTIDVAGVFSMPVGDGLTFFTEIGLPFGQGYTDGVDEKFGLAIAVKPGIKFAVNEFMAQFLVDFQQAVKPESETYFGMSVNFAYMLNEASCIFLGSSMPLSGVKGITENNWLMAGADEFGWTINVGYKHNFAW